MTRMVHERALAYALLSSSSAGFVYYTVWTLVLPFVDADQAVHALFPARHWAVALPALAGGMLVLAVALYASAVMLTAKRVRFLRQRDRATRRALTRPHAGLSAIVSALTRSSRL